jgi:hypothetical protein
MELYPDMAAVEAALKEDAIPYMRQLSAMTDSEAAPWFKHPKHAAAAGASSRHGAPLSAVLLHGHDSDQDAGRPEAGLDFRSKYGCQ